MKKKIYDILPPKLAKKIEKDSKLAGGITISKRKPQKAISHRKTERKFPIWQVVAGVLVIIIVIGVYLYNTLPYVKIQVSPKFSDVNIQDSLTADKSFQNVDLTQKTIPAQYIEIEKDGAQDFLATGSATNGGNASGTITVYNKVTPATPIILKAGTHFLSDSGKYFKSVSKITIPPMKGKTPGSVSVAVQAEQTGADFNIGASNFSVPGLSGTSYYYGVWAVSTSAMSGGFSGNVKKVTADDIQTAQGILTKKLSDDAISSIKSSLTQDEILLDGAVSTNMLSANSDTDANSIKDSFNESVKVQASALVFKKSDLQQFVKNDISAQLTDGQSLLEKSLSVNYSADSVDLQGGTEKINLQILAKSYYNLDLQSLVGSLSGKSSSDIKAIISSKYSGEVASTKVNFWPLWVNSAPTNQKRINISLNLQ